MWIILSSVLFLSVLTVRGQSVTPVKSQSNTPFASKLYEVVRQKPGNLLVSPASLQLVLGLTWLGAGGNTERQLSQGLGLIGDRDEARLGLKTLATTLKGGDGQTLTIANHMFLDKNLAVKEGFRNSAANILRAGADTVNFRSNPDDANAKINKWVASHTNDKITQLFDKGTINSDTIMVLANAVYFKAPWDLKFKLNRTRTKPFYTESGATVPVQMMAADGLFKYAYIKEVNAKVVQLPYKGLRSSMVVLLPVRKDGLARLEAGLASLDLDKIIEQLELDDDPIYLELPRFKLEHKTSLEDTLRKLGMSEMFENSANFSALADGLVKVSSVVQSSIIETNEEGSEAAAGSGSGFVNYSSPATFVADHPFIFLVRDDTTGTVLFMGRYTTPT